MYSVWTPSDCTLKSSSIFCTYSVDPKYVFFNHVRRTPKIRGYSVFRIVTRLNKLDCLMYISQNGIARLSHTIYIYIYPYFVGGVHFNLIYNLQLKPLFMRWTTSTALVIRNMRFVRKSKTKIIWCDSLLAISKVHTQVINVRWGRGANINRKWSSENDRKWQHHQVLTNKLQVLEVCQTVLRRKQTCRKIHIGCRIERMVEFGWEKLIKSR